MDDLDKKIERASDEFWFKIGEQYPEVKSGDFPPDAWMKFHNAMKEAVELWLEINR